jgi:hypothetical protein
MLEAAERHTADIATPGEKDAAELRRRFDIPGGSVRPRVYWRLTDNWLEMTVRFLARDHGTRELKDAMSREILARLDEAGVAVASSTYEIVGVPPIRLADGRARPGPSGASGV